MKRMRFLFTLIVLGLLSTSHAAFARNIRAGAARVLITPGKPMWLNGYAGRESPATGSLHPLWAKALVIEQGKNSRVIFVTTDLLGLSHQVVEDVYKRSREKYGISRSQLVMNASHTHSGPVVWPCLDVIHEFDAQEQATVEAYSLALADSIVLVIDKAMDNLTNAELFNAHVSAGFAVNRRNLRDHNNKGSTDHDVPVVKVTDTKGKVLAVMFGYACHNTTLVDDNHLFNGDYAGFAQIEIERNNPGAVALFLMGCGGDQNPEPRGTVELAKRYGAELADAVQTAVSGRMRPLQGPIRTAHLVVDLKFAPFDIAMYQKDAVGDNKYFQRRAKLMLQAYNKGWDVSTLKYPVQAVNFGQGFVIVALSGEVVVDYSIKTKKEYASANLYVAGYCNEVNCYIPSKRVLEEGGYEADENMAYYGMPGPFAADVEERVSGGIRQVLAATGVRPSTH